ncbi:large ribosomal subunit protein cL37 alpha [Humulus lupulus]|uniref:large ribosomal subunit protein cL37 alpha n=1 Tax=Humulus lupulus TaxID=3486 RepID=UPI002B4015A9|nr:large ribosomal subunit protein cL37 alpha [Humulus lupulus]
MGLSKKLNQQNQTNSIRLSEKRRKRATMALVVCSTSLNSPLLSSSFSSSSSTSVTSIPSISRLQIKPIDVHSKCMYGVQVQMPIAINRAAFAVVKVSSETDGTGQTESSEAPSETKEVEVSVDKLPLESKLKERMEQKLRMKLAKKIRLRRKRLVRKRKLRKKGRWPPSKMKKLKNV